MTGTVRLSGRVTTATCISIFVTCSSAEAQHDPVSELILAQIGSSSINCGRFKYQQHIPSSRGRPTPAEQTALEVCINEAWQSRNPFSSRWKASGVTRTSRAALWVMRRGRSCASGMTVLHVAGPDVPGGLLSERVQLHRPTRASIHSWTVFENEQAAQQTDAPDEVRVRQTAWPLQVIRTFRRPRQTMGLEQTLEAIREHYLAGYRKAVAEYRQQFTPCAPEVLLELGGDSPLVYRYYRRADTACHRLRLRHIDAALATPHLGRST